MRATNAKNMCIDESSPLTKKLVRRLRFVPRARILLSSFLGIVLLAALSGCGPSSSQGEGKPADPNSSANGLPELTEEIIRERINDARVWEVPEENGTGEPIVWNFDENEPKDIRIVERQMQGTRGTLVLDITTGSAPRARNPRHVAGQIRTDWELKTGWALRRWEIVNTENISMKYRTLPKPSDENSNS